MAEAPIPRYLVPFHPKRVAHVFTDILVVGGGLAGLRAALEVDPNLSVLVVTKGKLQTSNSQWAQGGIAGVLDPEDRFENHIEDTITAGGPLCEAEVVEFVVREAPEQIRQLIEWGTNFDEEAGQLALGREGGHSHHRIVHALGDRTGREIMRAIIQRVGTLENLQTWEHTFTLDLLSHQGTCRGAVVWHPQRGLVLVWAKQTVLAAGGAGQVYRETTNPEVATGDGQALAYRAGVELRDMEFMQFHPTMLYIAGSSRHLITEAVRGEGGHLVDCHGLRFMPDYDARGELAPRDIVSQSIVTQMEKTNHPNVYLDVRHLDQERLRQRFPGILRLCRKFGLELQHDLIPVRPGAHYMIGGVAVDVAGRTNFPALWAAGEVTSSGLHGANRLASNSLLEGLVFGARCGHGASQAAAGMPDQFTALDLRSPVITPPTNGNGSTAVEESLNVSDIRNSLQALMWRNVGIRRDATRLREAAEQIHRWSRYVFDRQFSSPEGWELQNMLCVAGVMIAAASDRRESRGVHLRSDYPLRDDEHFNRRLSYRLETTP